VFSILVENCLNYSWQITPSVSHVTTRIVFSVTRSFRNPSNMLILTSRNISYYYYVDLTALYFCGNHDTFFSGFFKE